MKQTELLKNLSKLTPYKKTKLEMYVIDAFKLNAEDQDNRSKHCPYGKKRFSHDKKVV